jgi:hypothetical protein
MPQIEKHCAVCLKPFLVYPYRAMVAKVCSYACSGKLLQTKVNRICRNCGKSFLINPSQFRAYKGAGKYCSRDCSYQGIVKETALKPIPDRYGRSGRKADSDWRRAIREKDQWTCQRCGKVEKHIHTHHIAPRSQRPDLRHDVSNGKCLCNACHSWVHEHPIEAKATGLLRGETYELARKKLRGSEHGCAKLTERDVIAIRNRHANGEQSVNLAAEYSVDRCHVWAIVTRRVWRHI